MAQIEEAQRDNAGLLKSTLTTTTSTAEPGVGQVILAPQVHKVSITPVAHAKAAVPGEALDLTLAEFAEEVRACAGAVYADKKDGPLFFPGKETGGRNDESAEEIHLLVLDYDKGSVPMGRAVQWVEERKLEAIIYESPSAKTIEEEWYKWRLVLRLATPWLRPEKAEWIAYYNRMREDFKLALELPDDEEFDPECSNPGREYFFPSKPNETIADRKVVYVEGGPWCGVDLLSLAKGKLKDAFQRVIDGEPYAEQGARDTTLTSLAGAIAKKYPDANPSEVALLFEPSREAMEAWDPGVPTRANLERKLERFQEQERKEQERRPRFTIKAGEPHNAVAFGGERLVQRAEVFERDGRLVTIRSLEKDEKIGGFYHPGGSPTIVDLPEHLAWTMLSECVQWEKRNKDGEGKPCDLSFPLVKAVLAQTRWPGARVLRGLSTSPIIHSDGSVKANQGFDAETGLFYTGGVMGVPENPTREDAQMAVDELKGVVKDFPWRSELDQVGWLAALLTVVGRSLCPMVPCFVINGNSKGVGKTKLVDSIAIITQGREVAHCPAARDDNELKKTILPLLMSGANMVLLDNAEEGSNVGWDSLNGVISSTEWEDRVLGASRTARVANNATWFITGNNLGIQGDITRRTIHLQLETEEVHPERRTDFDHENLAGWLKENHQGLLRSALTILAAYLKAKRPNVGIKPIGSFEDWSKIIGGSLVWLKQPNPCDLLSSEQEEIDPIAEAHRDLLVELKGKPPMTVREIQDAALFTSGLEEVLTAINPEKKDLGYVFRGLSNRWVAMPEGGKARLVKIKGRISKWVAETR